MGNNISAPGENQNITAEIKKVMPIPKSGIIMAYYNPNANIFNVPNGWLLCDGTNGTPDLRGRFIVGVGKGDRRQSYELGEIGGKERVLLNFSQIPPHNHNLPIDNACFKNGGCDNRSSLNYANQVNSSPLGIAEAPNQENVEPHENLPPYYSLVYLMKA